MIARYAQRSLLAAWIVAIAPAIASAQDGAPDAAAVAEAQALFRRGVELGEQDRWADALEHFRRSRALAERPSTVFNVGYASHRLSRFREAVAAFDEYRAMSAGEPSERRAEAERLRAEAVASLAEVRISIDPPDARLLVDGEAHDGDGIERIVVLDPGRHVLRATAEGRDEGTLAIAVLAGERRSDRLVLAPRAAHTDPPPPGRSVLDEPVFWIVSGAIVVAAGAGLGIGLGVAASEPPYGGSSGVVLESLRF